MEVVVKYNLELSEDKYAFELAQNSDGMFHVLVDLLEYLRKQYKYGDEGPEADFAAELRKRIYDDLRDRNVTVID